MHQKFEVIFDRILQDYESGENYDRLLSAKQSYIEITGVLHEEDDDFDSRMNCFNDWFVFNYELPSGEKVYEKYINQNDVDKEMKTILKSVRFSLFEFSKVNLKKQMVLRDYISDEKIALAKSHHQYGLLKEDVFIGHVAQIEHESYLLRGVRIIPSAVKSILKKKSKQFRKNANPRDIDSYLLKVENLKTKSSRYAHIEPVKIFVFDE